MLGEARFFENDGHKKSSRRGAFQTEFVELCFCGFEWNNRYK